MKRSTFMKRLILGFLLVSLLTALIVVTSLFQGHQQVTTYKEFAATEWNADMYTRLLKT